MSESNDLSYCELRAKEVVNSTDGRRMGRIVDIQFSASTGVIKGIVVPVTRRSFFGKCQELFIPWKCVTKIGEDVILVNVIMDATGNLNCKKSQPPPYCPPQEDDCDCYPPQSPQNCTPPNHYPPPHNCPPPNCAQTQPNCPPKPGFPDCDRRCEKCMLFDCAYRWLAST